MAARALLSGKVDQSDITYVQFGEIEMVKRVGDPRVMKLVVSTLRVMAGMTQMQFGRAARVDQGHVSRYETGKESPPEESLRRMAAAAEVSWPTVLHLKRLFTAFLAAAAGPSSFTPAEPLDPAIFQSALLAVAPYTTSEVEKPSPEEERAEAETIWAALEGFPPHRRRRLVELALGAFPGWALAERVHQASRDAAAGRPEEARELAELARFIAEKSPDEESRRQG